MSGPREPSPRASNPDFRRYQTSRLLATLADQMLSVAIGWQVYQVSGRAFDLGMLGLVQFVPSLAFSLVAGHTSDRTDRRTIAVVCYGALAATSVLLFVAARGAAVVPALYVAAFLFATARTFLAPAQQALLPDLVPAEHFPSAVAWSSSLGEAGAIAGPALGGGIYGVAHGAAAVYLTSSVAYLLAALSAGALSVRKGRAEPQAASLETVLAGAVYVWKNELLLASISLDLFAVLFGGAVALLPVYARDILHVGPWGLGVLRSAPAVGAAGVALVLAIRPLRRRTGVILLASVGVFGGATIVFGVSRGLWLSLTALAVIGASDMVSVVVRSTLVQVVTPAAMRGRVSAVNMVFVGASSELGALESGMAAAWLGAVPAVVLGGVAACGIVALYAVLFARLRRVDTLDAASHPSVPSVYSSS